MRPTIAALLAVPVVLPAGAAAYYYQTVIGPAVRDIGVPSVTLLGQYQALHPVLRGNCFLASISLPEGLEEVPNETIFAAFKTALGFPRSQLPRPGWCWMPSDRKALADQAHFSTQTTATTPDSSDNTGSPPSPSSVVPEELFSWRCDGHDGAVWASVKDGFKAGERTHLHFVIGSVKSTAVDEFDFPGGYLLKAAHHAYKRYLVFDARERAVRALSGHARADPVQCKLKER